eukprot:Lithocolla_globosa_v1_NODE_825_length_3226_cov_19.169032.p1 type:complete len:475 gc:universal NODE_825_length_3226_cov_19.169032:839-2263(+)
MKTLQISEQKTIDEDLLSKKLLHFQNSFTGNKARRVMGITAVWNRLTATHPLYTEEVSFPCIRRGFLRFTEAFEVYSDELPSLSTNPTFISDLLHVDYGLPVVYFEFHEEKWIIQREIDVVSFLSAIEQTTAKSKSSPYFDKHTLRMLTDSMDSEWDKNILKMVFSRNLSRKEIRGAGLSPDRLVKNTENIWSSLKKVHDSYGEAEDMLSKKWQAEILITKQKIQVQADRLSRKKNIWSANVQRRVQEDIDMLIERKEFRERRFLRNDNKSKRAWNGGIKRTAAYLQNVGRYKRRKLGVNAGAPFQEIDEPHIALAIEDASTVHLRRKDVVHYTNGRVKKREMLTLCNFRRRFLGMRPIKSASTVTNRGQPRHKRTRQAKLHRGMCLWCTKKPTKEGAVENENTYFQRKHKKHIFTHLIGSNVSREDRALTITRSMDDAQYIRPGTSDSTSHGMVGRCTKLVRKKVLRLYLATI